MKNKGKNRFKYMTFEQLDNEIDSLTYNWMKPLMLSAIREIRPEYKYKTQRKKEVI